MILDIIIPGAPHAQGRARFARMGNHVKTYDPKESKDWKGYARQVMWKAGVDGPNPGGYVFIPEGPVAIIVTACFPCTSTDAKKKKLSPLLRWHTKKPDLDNIVKAVKDAAKGILWTDDSQVCSMLASKVILPAGESPHVRVKVYPIAGEPKVNDGQVAIV